MAPTSTPLQRRASVEVDDVRRIATRRLSLERAAFAAAPNSFCDATSVILASPATPLPAPPPMRRSLTKFGVRRVGAGAGAAHRRPILPLMERGVASPAHQCTAVAPAHHRTPTVPVMPHHCHSCRPARIAPRSGPNSAPVPAVSKHLCAPPPRPVRDVGPDPPSLCAVALLWYVRLFTYLSCCPLTSIRLDYLTN